MKIVLLLLTGLMLVVGVYVLTATMDLPPCAANIDIRQSNDVAITGALKDSTCPDYDGMVIRISDANGNFLFSGISAMRVGMEGLDNIEWKIISIEQNGDPVGRASMPKPSVEILSKVK